MPPHPAYLPWRVAARRGKYPLKRFMGCFRKESGIWRSAIGALAVAKERRRRLSDLIYRLLSSDVVRRQASVVFRPLPCEVDGEEVEIGYGGQFRRRYHFSCLPFKHRGHGGGGLGRAVQKPLSPPEDLPYVVKYTAPPPGR